MRGAVPLGASSSPTVSASADDVRGPASGSTHDRHLAWRLVHLQLGGQFAQTQSHQIVLERGDLRFILRSGGRAPPAAVSGTSGTGSAGADGRTSGTLASRRGRSTVAADASPAGDTSVSAGAAVAPSEGTGSGSVTRPRRGCLDRGPLRRRGTGAASFSTSGKISISRLRSRLRDYNERARRHLLFGGHSAIAVSVTGLDRDELEVGHGLGLWGRHGLGLGAGLARGGLRLRPKDSLKQGEARAAEALARAAVPLSPR